MHVKTALIVCLAVAASGCATTSRTMLGPARPAVAPEQVRIYYTPPPGRYEEIAMLSTASGALTYGEQNKTNEVMGKLRASAAQVGANGVLFQGAAQGYGGSNVGIGVGSSSYGRRSSVGGGIGVNVSPSPTHAAGIAIYVFDPPPMDYRPTVTPGSQPPRN
ncbi:hypothetical protein INQ41_00615 [Lysobacter ciconiae]|uniref:Lipoprotein n=1 Tax=Novilysobacter ciconiae TaxID=2781022 RepID=A0A7S6ZSN2_9GAMM|nr:MULTISPECIES: hypothetical protein [Lysobacter]QOW19634.1 hypothetical protein INQ41_00615 [Lysobacter ciconiae]QOY62858.1 hypothetical protein INQ40_00615 [Lysobacter sp. H21R4]